WVGQNCWPEVGQINWPLTQEKCRTAFIALFFLEDAMILALETDLTKLGNYVRVIPPAVRLIPAHIAIKIAEDDCLWPAKIFAVDLKILPKLAHVPKCFIIAPLRPDGQHSEFSIDGERKKKPKIFRTPGQGFTFAG
ncbi:MAG: hypothetical protein VW877_04305, partial [Pseudomonadaceae bacterium]